MSIRHISYLTCDGCLRICDGSDSDNAAGARHIGKRRGWRRTGGRDLCPVCQGERKCGTPHCSAVGELVAPGVVLCSRHRGEMVAQ